MSSSAPARKPVARNSNGVSYPGSPYEVRFSQRTTRWDAAHVHIDSTTYPVTNSIYPVRSFLAHGYWQNGWLMPTARQCYYMHQGPPSGYVSYLNRDGSGYTHTNFPPLSVRSGWHDFWSSSGYPQWDYLRVERAKTEALTKIVAGGAQLGATLFESKKTLSMIAGTSLDLLQAYRAARRGRWKQALDHLGISHHSFKSSAKNVSGRWLELQYGWLPLAGEVSSTYETIKKHSTETWKPFTVVRNLEQAIDEKLIEPHGNYTNLLKASGKQTYRVQLWYNVTDPKLHLLSQLGLTNPASIIWELIPFSFLVDWFLPVGTYLEAWTATLGCEFLSGTITSCHHGKEEFITVWDGSDSQGYTIGSAAQKTATRGYTRRPLTDWPTPSLYLKSPLSTKHMLNALALINQRWR